MELLDVFQKANAYANLHARCFCIATKQKHRHCTFYEVLADTIHAWKEDFELKHNLPNALNVGVCAGRLTSLEHMLQQLCIANNLVYPTGLQAELVAHNGVGEVQFKLVHSLIKEDTADFSRTISICK